MENRIAERRNARGWSQRELAKHANTTGQQIGMLERGERGLDVDWLKRLADALDCAPTDLLPAEMVLSEAAKPRPKANQADATSVPEVDVRGGMGGGGLVALEINTTDEWGNTAPIEDVRATWEIPTDYLRHELRVAPRRIAIAEGRGDSMYPTIHSHDRVMIDLDDTNPSPGGVFAVWDGMGVVFKRVEYIPNSEPPTLKLISDNANHSSYERTFDEIRIIGRCVGFIRRM